MRDDREGQAASGTEAALVRALERRPEVAVPDGFAARVARAMPVKTPARAEARPVFGRAAGYLAVAAMMVVLMVLARLHPEEITAGRGFVFAVELLLLAQLLAVGLWLGMQKGGLE